MTLIPTPKMISGYMMIATHVETLDWYWINGVFSRTSQKRTTGYKSPTPPVKTGDTINVGVGVFNMTKALGDPPEQDLDVIVYLMIRPNDDYDRWMIGPGKAFRLYARHPEGSGVCEMYLDLQATIPPGLIGPSTTGLEIEGVVVLANDTTRGDYNRVRAPDGSLYIPVIPPVSQTSAGSETIISAGPQTDLYQPPPEVITPPAPTTTSEVWEEEETVPLPPITPQGEIILQEGDPGGTPPIGLEIPFVTQETPSETTEETTEEETTEEETTEPVISPLLTARNIMILIILIIIALALMGGK